jgi:hypothetical protein
MESSIATAMAMYCTIERHTPGPSKFAVDPAAENGDVPLYARSLSLGVMSDDQVIQHFGAKSEGPGAL